MDYEIIDQYLIYKELRADAFGKNFRARRMVNDRPADRKIVVDIHPFITDDIISMEHLKKHFDEIKKSDIENLLVPENIFRHLEKTFWVYPHIKGKSLKDIIEDSERKKIPISFDLAISIALKCSILLDIGSMIILDSGSSSHGFLTPDNIIVSTDGEIYLKYYGLLRGIERNNPIFSEIKSTYHQWIAPEFSAGDEILHQSDFYYLGLMVYRIITGKNFSFIPGVAFETAVSSISFTHDIPSTDTEFLTNIIEFFRKTLNPDISRRFSNINEFTRFISTYFCVSDSLSISSSIGEYMNSLYSGDFEEEKTVPIEEIRQKEPAATKPVSTPEIIEEIPRKLRQSKRSPLGAIVLISGLIIVSGFLFFKFVLKPSAEAGSIPPEIRKESAPIQDSAARPDSGEHVEHRDNQSDQEESQVTSAPAAETGSTGTPETEKITPPGKIQRKILQPKPEPEAVIRQGVPQIPLGEVHKKPVKISGSDPEFSSSLKEKYGQLPDSIYVNALIDDKGNIEKVNILNQIPNEMELVLKGTLYKWKFTPARKNNQIVKVWIPLSIQMKCKPTPPSAVVQRSAPRDIPEIASEEADIKPVEVSCPELRFSETLKRNYMGRRASLQGTILINEQGRVTRVKITSHIPEDLKNHIEKQLLSWTFMPGKKRGENVKVWYPISLKIHIR